MSQAALTPTMRLKRNDRAISVEMDGDTVMMDIELGSYFALTGSGTFIWARLENPTTLDEIAQAVREEFDVNEYGSIEDDIFQFVTELFAKGLVNEAT